MPALRTRDTQSKSLEVTTDVPQPPTLAIISPTPRAFTFPDTHNLADSPYSTPSHSPFEPDLHPFPSQLQSTSPPLLDPRPSISSVPETSSSPVSASTRPHQHQRRKSSCSSADEERRPRKGDSDYIKRPENAFILFRRKCCEERQAAANDDKLDGQTKKQRQADLSKTISQQWKSLSPEERKVWEDKAKERKKEHEQLYPNYVYRPQRSKDKAKGKKVVKTGSRKDEHEHETDTEPVSFILPAAPRHGRSASAPTPPPYQSIMIPSVYHMTPSCPTSPSLLPMISRHASHTGHSQDSINDFDFLPHDNYMPTSFGQAGQLEASLQSSEFLRNIFAIPNMPSMPQKNEQPMIRLTVPQPQEILSSQQISPSSSGPSSPINGPFTPLGAIAKQSFAEQPTNIDPSFAQQSHMGLHFDVPLQSDFSYNWESNSIWPSGNETLLGDDFDLNSIPPIELGVPKLNEESFGERVSALDFGQEFAYALEGRDIQQGQVLGFDEMMGRQMY